MVDSRLDTVQVEVLQTIFILRNIINSLMNGKRPYISTLQSSKKRSTRYIGRAFGTVYSTVPRKGHTKCVLFSVSRDPAFPTYNATSRLITRDLDL